MAEFGDQTTRPRLPSQCCLNPMNQSISQSVNNWAVEEGYAAVDEGLNGQQREAAAPHSLTQSVSARGSVLSPCVCSLRAHCEFGAAAAAAAAECSHPPLLPRLATAASSSKPVVVQTTSSGRRFIPP